MRWMKPLRAQDLPVSLAGIAWREGSSEAGRSLHGTGESRRLITAASAHVWGMMHGGDLLLLLAVVEVGKAQALQREKAVVILGVKASQFLGTAPCLVVGEGQLLPTSWDWRLLLPHQSCSRWELGACLQLLCMHWGAERCTSFMFLL